MVRVAWAPALASALDHNPHCGAIADPAIQPSLFPLHPSSRQIASIVTRQQPLQRPLGSIQFEPDTTGSVVEAVVDVAGAVTDAVVRQPLEGYKNSADAALVLVHEIDPVPDLVLLLIFAMLRTVPKHQEDGWMPSPADIVVVVAVVIDKHWCNLDNTESSSVDLVVAGTDGKSNKPDLLDRTLGLVMDHRVERRNFDVFPRIVLVAVVPRIVLVAVAVAVVAVVVAVAQAGAAETVDGAVGVAVVGPQ
ncbi:hypothetical protein NE237_028213 [Protea cynaroides]|uniref:Uncharacterized protein n=1 Tax=Protea cynaroides TaxID=273540 RepID=A0A9Q0GNZ4_9MAGN|nr:hypothetical protein NE237_028213 [Protea cynaroides]